MMPRTGYETAMDEHETRERVTAVVLAGGESRRMGAVDKTLLEVEGRTLTRRVVDVVAPLFREVIVASGVTGKFDGVPGVREVADHERGVGPLAGMRAGLAACNTEWAFVVAADMPRLDPELVLRVTARIDETKLATVPRHGDFREPLHAVYRRDVIAGIDRFLDEGGRSVNRLLDRISVCWVDVDDTDLECFKNVNRPEDLKDL
jgi:molybdenum cofactor guanylyltransferase